MRVLCFAAHMPVPKGEKMNDITEQEFQSIRDYIQEHYGIHLGNEKKSLVYSRLRMTLQEKGFTSFTQYYDYLVNDKTGEAVSRFIDKMTTNHTYFMREPDHFDHFREAALPFVESTAPDKDARVWCAGCASGEEAYTLEMTMQDYFRGKPGWNTELLATDISTNILDRAVEGVYDEESVKTLPQSWRRMYFKEQEAGRLAISKELKKLVTFRAFNLMQENSPFRRNFHVIFCRNVMIYFNNTTRDALVRRFYDMLEPGGYLYIGHSESLNQMDTGFKYIKPAVYRRPL